MTVPVAAATASPLPASSPTRRALLAGALGGLGALAATAIGRAGPARAADSDPVLLGIDNSASHRTLIRNTTDGSSGDAFKAIAHTGSFGYGVHGVATHGIGVNGDSTVGTGVDGSSSSGPGVHGTSVSNDGVSGSSDSGVGVRGESASVQGVIGIGSIGVEGTSNNQYAWGVGGYNTAAGGIGVWGAAEGAGSRGVSGFSAAGRGVHGESGSGYAGYFKGKVYTSTFHEMREVTTPNAPAANKGRLFMRDNGSGKTQLCVRFNTGAVQVIATQP